MKIIKDGTLPTKRFECKVCGCVFEADEKEYYALLLDGGRGPSECMTTTRIVGYYCECPRCGRIAKQLHD